MHKDIAIWAIEHDKICGRANRSNQQSRSMANKTFYDILQVSRNADPETIKDAYKSFAQRYHPLRNPDNPDAEKYLKEINRAYEVLSDPVKRAGYDAALAEDDEDAATSSNGSKKSHTGSRAENDANPFKTTERAAPFDRNTTPAKKRDYYWMLDILAALAVAELFHSFVVTNFHGSPEATGWAVAISIGLGGAVGFPLSKYIRTKITKNMQSRGTVFFVSLSISLGLMLAIVTTTVLLERKTKSPAVYDLSTFQPEKPPQLDLTEFSQPAPPGTALQPASAIMSGYLSEEDVMHPLPNSGYISEEDAMRAPAQPPRDLLAEFDKTLPPSAVAKITASDGTPTDQGFEITLHNNNPDWTVTELHLMVFETEGRLGSLIQSIPTVGTVVSDVVFKETNIPYGSMKVFFYADTNKAYGFALRGDMKGFQPAP